jgi:hypothetical protein
LSWSRPCPCAHRITCKPLTGSRFLSFMIVRGGTPMPRGRAAFAGIYDARISPLDRDISELAGVRKVRSEISRLLSIAVDAGHPNRSAGCSIAASRARVLSITRGTSYGCRWAAEWRDRSIAPLAWRAYCMPPCVNPRRLARCDRSRTLGEIQSCCKCISRNDNQTLFTAI